MDKTQSSINRNSSTLIVTLLFVIILQVLSLASWTVHANTITQTFFQEPLLGVGGPKCTAAEQKVSLSDAPLPQELSANEIRCYRFHLEQNQFVHIIIMQQKVDVQVQLYRIDDISPQPKYELIDKTIDSPNEFSGEEPVSEVADRSSDYLLVVQNSPGVTSPGTDYTIHLQVLRPATDKDRSYVRAERKYLEGWAKFGSAGFIEDKLKREKAVGDAVDLLKGALTDLADTDRPRLKLRILFQLARAKSSLGEATEALTYFDQERALAKSIPDQNTEATALYNIATLYNQLDKIPEATIALEQAVKLGGGLSNDVRIQMFVNVGNLYRQEGRISEAANSYSQAVPLISKIDDAERRSYLLTAAGMAFFNISELLEARELYLQALKVVGNEFPQQRAYSLHQLGVVYQQLGRTQEALNTFKELEGLRTSEAYKRIRIPAEAQEDEDIAEVYFLANLGGVYASLNQPKLALDYYQKALNLSHGRFKDADAYAHLYKGNAHADLGEKQQALEEFGEARKLFTNDKRGTANVLSNIGKMIAEEGQKQRALDEYLLPAIRLQTEIGDSFGRASTMTNVGGIYLDLRSTKKAASFLNDALALRNSVNDKKGEIATRYHLARLERARRNIPAGLEQLRLAKKLIEDLRGSILDFDLRSSYFANFRPVYSLDVGLLLELHRRHKTQHHAQLALQSSESARTRSLLDTLAEVKANIRSGIDSALLERERRAQEKMAEVLARQAAITRITGSGKPITQQEKTRIDAEYNSALTELTVVRSAIREKSKGTKAYELLTPVALDGKQIQKMLDDNTLLLEFILGEEQSYLLTVSNKEIVPIPLPKRSQIEELCRLAYNKLKGRNEIPEELDYDERIRIGKQLDADFAVLARKLSQVLLGKIAHRLGTKRLLIVKDGALQYIPFNALPEPTTGRRSGSSSPLLMKHEIVVLPSASTIASLRELPRRPVSPQTASMLLMFADPVYNMIDKRAQESIQLVAGRRGPDPELKFRRLAFSTLEKAQITELLPNQVKTWEAFEVNRSNLTDAELGSHRVLHFSMHAIFDFKNPSTSGLVLSLFNRNGVLEERPIFGINDVYNLNLSAELVVLSACQTALGKEIRGEGLVGITRGFMYAGAPRVVSSLWEVDDPETARLMTSFYTMMLRNPELPVAAALRAAQQDVWKEYKKSPYYWAAFELQGEWKGNIRP